MREMRVKSRESILFNNRKSLLWRGLPSVSPVVPYGPSPLILRKAFVHCFSQKSRSLQRDNLWSRILLATPSGYCLAILAESYCHTRGPQTSTVLQFRESVLSSWPFCLLSNTIPCNFFFLPILRSYDLRVWTYRKSTFCMQSVTIFHWDFSDWPPI